MMLITMKMMLMTMMKLMIIMTMTMMMLMLITMIMTMTMMTLMLMTMTMMMLMLITMIMTMTIMMLMVLMAVVFPVVQCPPNCIITELVLSLGNYPPARPLSLNKHHDCQTSIYATVYSFPSLTSSNPPSLPPPVLSPTPHPHIHQHQQTFVKLSLSECLKNVFFFLNSKTYITYDT